MEEQRRSIQAAYIGARAWEVSMFYFFSLSSLEISNDLRASLLGSLFLHFRLRTLLTKEGVYGLLDLFTLVILHVTKS